MNKLTILAAAFWSFAAGVLVMDIARDLQEQRRPLPACMFAPLPAPLPEPVPMPAPSLTKRLFFA